MNSNSTTDMQNCSPRSQEIQPQTQASVPELEQGALRRADLKDKKPITTEQLPVFRAAANILYILTKTVTSAPRKMMRFCDKAIADAAEMVKCIAIANLVAGEDRVYYLHVAEANAITVRCYVKIFVSLGAMSKNEAAAFKKQMKSVTAQIAGWRASTSCQCRKTQVI